MAHFAALLDTVLKVSDLSPQQLRQLVQQLDLRQQYLLQDPQLPRDQRRQQLQRLMNLRRRALQQL